jgi:hypothetical protein
MLAGSGQTLDVLVVAKPDDVHGNIVDTALVEAGASVARLSLNTWRDVRMFFQLGGPLRLDLESGPANVTRHTTVWWRRPGSPAVGDLEPEEAALVAAESMSLLLGTLLAVNPRWVDPPTVVDLAEVKVHQLAVAECLGISVPSTIVTNDVEQARRFASKGPIITKAVSSGPGLAPYTGLAPMETLSLVEASPTLLQSAIAARADLRVVTVGESAFSWSRVRTANDRSIDWRENDPEGVHFAPMGHTPVEEQAVHLTRALGLSFSVQDWLALDERLLLLEVNAQGNWLFLADAEALVVPALVAHLLPQRAGGGE